MATINPLEVSLSRFHSQLLGAITPRPIAFASTVDARGNVNLSPFSFFNCFGANPPLLIFSAVRRTRDGTVKHTYENVLEVPEVVINIVNFSMVQQASLASNDYPKGVNEFIKSGLTQVPSAMVKPPRVGECPVSIECKVLQVVQAGTAGGGANLIICEALLMHIDDQVLDEEGLIDPFRLDAVGRLGRDWFCRVQGNALFRVPRPGESSIGIDELPEHIRNSRVLTGNDLGLLAATAKKPGRPAEIGDNRLMRAKQNGPDAVHRLAQEYILEGKVTEAWAILVDDVGNVSRD